MSGSTIIAFLLLTVPAFITPGPNNLMLMASGARFGVRRTLPHLLGIHIGFPLMLFVIGLGLGELFTLYPLVGIVLKYVSALYFLWMAWHLLGLKIGEGEKVSRPMRFYEAMLFQWVNPKAWAIAISFVAAFIVPGEGRLLSLVLIALGCLVVGPFASVVWLVSGQQLHNLLRRTRTEKYLGVFMAILMLSAVVLFLI